MRRDLQPVVYLQLPMIKKWSHTLNYTLNLGYLIPSRGEITFNLTEIFALTTFVLDTTEQGILHP